MPTCHTLAGTLLCRQCCEGSLANRKKIQQKERFNFKALSWILNRRVSHILGVGYRTLVGYLGEYLEDIGGNFGRLFGRKLGEYLGGNCNVIW